MFPLLLFLAFTHKEEVVANKVLGQVDCEKITGRGSNNILSGRAISPAGVKRAVAKKLKRQLGGDTFIHPTRGGHDVLTRISRRPGRAHGIRP